MTRPSRSWRLLAITLPVLFASCSTLSLGGAGRWEIEAPPSWDSAVQFRIHDSTEASMASYAGEVELRVGGRSYTVQGAEQRLVGSYRRSQWYPLKPGETAELFVTLRHAAGVVTQARVEFVPRRSYLYEVGIAAATQRVSDTPWLGPAIESRSFPLHPEAGRVATDSLRISWFGLDRKCYMSCVF